MPIYLLFRIASILIVGLIATQSASQKTWISIVYGFGFAHYVMAMIYSKGQLADTVKQPYALVPSFSIVVLGAALYFGQVSLLFYFSLHHAFNEAFILNAGLPRDNSDVKAFRGSAVLVHLFLYFLILRRQASFSFTPSNPLYSLALGLYSGNRYLLPYLAIGGLAISYVIFFYYLSRIRSLMNLRTLIENCGFELLGLIVLAASIQVRFSYLHIVLYHFVFWSLFPLPKMWTLGRADLVRYLGLTIVCTAAFLLLSPIGLFPSRYATSMFQQQFMLWSYIHITSSFLLSNAHPEWIVNLFRPKAAVPAKA